MNTRVIGFTVILLAFALGFLTGRVFLKNEYRVREYTPVVQTPAVLIPSASVSATLTAKPTGGVTVSPVKKRFITPVVTVSPKQ